MVEYFFRSQEDGYVFPLFSPWHFLLLALMLGGVFLIQNNIWDKKGLRHKLSYFLGILLFLDQIILYTWQLASGYFRLEVSLPLYHCRLAVLFLLIGVFFSKDFFKKIGILWGFLGSTMAMIVPNLYEFHFPHYTNFNFFICHIGMAWLVCNLLKEQNLLWKRQDFLKILVFTDVYNVFLALLNGFMTPYFPKVNYGYMKALPGNLAPLSHGIGHVILMLFLFDFALALAYLFCLNRDLIKFEIPQEEYNTGP